MRRVRDSWDRRIRRAGQLIASGSSAESLLTFYVRVLQRQKDLYYSLSSPPAGSLARDLMACRPAISALLHDVAQHGPDPLVVEARRLLEAEDSTMLDVLSAYWRAPSDRQFFAKAVLQPYGARLAEAGVSPTDRGLTRTDNRCPRCGGAPQLSMLDAAGAASEEGSSRQLLCAGCLTPWPFRRVLCPYCGEEDERKLGYYQSPALEHLRVEACDSCGRYLKSVDLAKLGLAVPLVDEVAGAALDVWARDHGYEKIELNLVGL